MEVINLEEYIGRQAGITYLEDRLKKLASGTELAILLFKDNVGNDKKLILAPMSRVQLTIK